MNNGGSSRLWEECKLMLGRSDKLQVTRLRRLVMSKLQMKLLPRALGRMSGQLHPNYMGLCLLLLNSPSQKQLGWQVLFPSCKVGIVDTPVLDACSPPALISATLSEYVHDNSHVKSFKKIRITTKCPVLCDGFCTQSWKKSLAELFLLS